MSKLVLFDIDGTLILTGGAGGRGLTRAFSRTYQVQDAFRGIAMPGRTDRAILLEALRAVGEELDESTLERFRRIYCEALREEIVPPHPAKRVMPGVRALLDRLDAREDVFLGLLSGNFAEAARIKLEHFDLWRYFACGAYGDDAVERAELVGVAVERARACGAPDVPPHDIVIVGDTPLDVECARANGAMAVAVATGDFNVDALQASGAHAVLPDLSDTDAFLRLLE